MRQSEKIYNFQKWLDAQPEDFDPENEKMRQLGYDVIEMARKYLALKGWR